MMQTETENKVESMDLDKETPENTDILSEELSQEENTAPEPEAKIPEAEPGIQALKADAEKLKDQYIRLLAEFENYKKRTAKEKLELIKSAGEDVMSALLPVLDDFERTLIATDNADNLSSVKEGLRLVTGNFFKAMNKKGLEPIITLGANFDSNLHEAITTISVAEDEKKGKVIEEVEKGYKLNDKVIRFAKVIVGE